MTNQLATLSGDHSFMAMTPAGMEQAQHGMILWCDQKLELVKQDLADLERTVAEAQNAGLKSHTWKAHIGKARAKLMFYRKVKAALMAGYYIVPPFPVQNFAIRTKRNYVRGHVTDYRNSSDWEQSAQRLDIGEGKFQNPFPTKLSFRIPEKDPAGNLKIGNDGKAITKRQWTPGDWDALDFPFKLVKPEIIAAVGKVLREKIFDSLGVLPQYKTPDPIVVGQLIPPHRPHDRLTFFVAWWMDPKDL